MRVSVIEFEGSIEELEALPELKTRLSGGKSGTVSRPPKERQALTLGPDDEAILGQLSPEVAEAIRNRSRTRESLTLVAKFLDSIQRWPHVTYGIGTSRKAQDGLAWMIRVGRNDSRSRAFALVDARRSQITFRLDETVLASCKHAYARNVRAGVLLRIRLRLESDDALSEAIDLAKEAYEEATAGPG